MLPLLATLTVPPLLAAPPLPATPTATLIDFPVVKGVPFALIVEPQMPPPPPTLSARIAADWTPEVWTAPSFMTITLPPSFPARPVLVGNEIYRHSVYGQRHPLSIQRVTPVIDLARALGWLDE